MTGHLIDDWIVLESICASEAWSNLACIEALEQLGIDREDAEAYVDFAQAEHDGRTNAADLLSNEQRVRLTGWL
jgi:hypothetical protein